MDGIFQQELTKNSGRICGSVLVLVVAAYRGNIGRPEQPK